MAIQGRRNCRECGDVFWDEKQEIEQTLCKEHIKRKK